LEIHNESDCFVVLTLNLPELLLIIFVCVIICIIRVFSKGKGYLFFELLGFLDFVHRPVFCKLENTWFRKLDLT
jgi:hypothetical protein